MLSNKVNPVHKKNRTGENQKKIRQDSKKPCRINHNRWFKNHVRRMASAIAERKLNISTPI